MNFSTSGTYGAPIFLASVFFFGHNVFRWFFFRRRRQVLCCARWVLVLFTRVCQCFSFVCSVEIHALISPSPKNPARRTTIVPTCLEQSSSRLTITAESKISRFIRSTWPLHNSQDGRPSLSMPRGHAPAIQQGKITAKWLNINEQFICFLTCTTSLIPVAI